MSPVWRRLSSNAWHLCDEYGTLAYLRKDNNRWYGRVLPRTTDHIGPITSLKEVMMQVEKSAIVPTMAPSLQKC